jgi:transposase
MKIAKDKLQLNISKTTMYELLYNEDQSYKKPEKRFYEADEAEQNIWLSKKIPEILQCVKKNNAILYFEDEANISLNAVIGKTWGPIGKTTIQKSTGNKASISAMSAITSSGRLIFTLHEHKISSVEIIQFLKQILSHHKNKDVVVVMDNASCHKSKLTKSYIASQKKLHVFYLPPRSPEFNPDEKVWNYLKNEELKSHQAKTKSELKVLAKNKLMSMSKKPRLLMALFKRCDVANLYLQSHHFKE